MQPLASRKFAMCRENCRLPPAVSCRQMPPGAKPGTRVDQYGVFVCDALSVDREFARQRIIDAAYAPPSFWRYTLQPWPVPSISTLRIFPSREVCAVSRQFPNRNQLYNLNSPGIGVVECAQDQSYELDSPRMDVVSKGPMAAISSEISRCSQRATVGDDVSR